MPFITIGTTSQLQIKVPTRGTQNWDETMRTDTFLKIAQHDHSGSSGNGTQLSTTAIADDAITGAKIRLDNNENLTARNAANSADLNLLKASASDELVFGITIATADFQDDGFTLSDNADNTKKLAFQLSGITTATTRTITIPDASDTMAVLAATQTLTNKTISADSNTLSGIAASSFVLSDGSGNIDGAAAQKAIPTGVVVGTSDSQTLTNKTISADSNTLSGIAASSFVLSDGSGNIDGAAAQKAIPTGTVVGTSDSQTLTNKSIDSDNNTITNIVNADIKAAAAIALNKLAATTINRALVSDGSGFVSAATTTATEIGYVNGVTSAIQTQIDGKQASDATLTALAAHNTNGLLTQTAADTFTGRTLTGTTDEIDVSNGDGVSGNPTVGIADNPVLPGTGAVQVPSGTTAQRPGTPTNGDFRYNSSTSKFEGYQGGAWGELGAGSGVNYIADSDAEGGVGSWATYADAAGTDPVDGTGGSPTITWTQNSTTPLRDTADFKFTKDAANRQGEGASYDFTIDKADLASVIRIEFDYDASDADYADDDIRIKIYDKDGTALIDPVGRDLKAGKGKHVCYFQTDSANDDYRLIIHQSSTNAAAYDIYFDNIQVGPATRTYSTPVSEWTSYTPGTTFDNTTASGFWRRVGDQMEVQTRLLMSGAPSSATFEMDIPSGYTIDTSKLAGSTLKPLGIAIAWDNGTGQHAGHVYYQDTNSVRVLDSNPSGQPWTQANPIGTIASNDEFLLQFSVPITGWGSQVQMSDEADTRVVAARYSTNAAQSFNTGSTDIIDFEDTTYGYDTHGAVTTGASWKFTAQSSGYYQVDAQILFQAASWTAGQLGELLLFRDTTQVASLDGFEAQGTGTWYTRLNGSATIYLTAGQYLQLKAYQQSGGTISLDANNTQNYVSISKVQGPSAIAANELVAAKYGASGATAINPGPTQIKFDSKIIDTHNAVTTGASWKFTAPVSGTYSVQAGTALATTSGFDGVNEYIEMYVYKDGVKDSLIYSKRPYTNEYYPNARGNTIIQLNAGQYIDIRLTQTSGGSLDTIASTSDCYVCIQRIGF